MVNTSPDLVNQVMVLVYKLLCKLLVLWLWQCTVEPPRALLNKRTRFRAPKKSSPIHIMRFDRNRAHSLCSFYTKVEGATKLKFAPFCSS